MSFTVQAAQKFFGDLYDREHAPDLGKFEAAAIRLVASVEGEHAVQAKDVAAGDKALAVLMLNHLMSAPRVDPSKKAALTAAALLNIKQATVGDFVDLFPDMTLEQLTKSAEQAGYKVEVLDQKVAGRLPRSLVGR